MSTHNFETLSRAIIASSAATTWARAVEEWQVVGMVQDPSESGVCVCGKTGLVYLYTIHNARTSSTLFPIGSSCVELFEVEELDVRVNVLRRLFELRTAFAAGELRMVLFTACQPLRIRVVTASPCSPFRICRQASTYVSPLRSIGAWLRN
ncbi:hypothetical protein [Microbacterium aurantiacum]|uniref:hypothetical protein n=1 Tax=Microbacterium aurantiacum TaxID=162393 RepID=UPI003431CAD8